MRAAAPNSRAMVLILGSQGVGKTTLINLLLYLLTAGRRKVYVQQMLKNAQGSGVSLFWWWDGERVGHTYNSKMAHAFLQPEMVVVVDGGAPEAFLQRQAAQLSAPLLVSVSPRLGFPLFKDSHDYQKVTHLWVPPWESAEVLSYIARVPSAGQESEALRRYGLVGGVARLIFGQWNYEQLKSQQQHAIRSCQSSLLRDVEAALHSGDWPAHGEHIILIDADTPAAAADALTGTNSSAVVVADSGEGGSGSTSFSQRAYARFCSPQAMLSFMARRGEDEYLNVLRFIDAGRQWGELGTLRGHKWEDVFISHMGHGFIGRCRDLKDKAAGPTKPDGRFQLKKSSPIVFTSLPALSNSVSEQRHSLTAQQGQQSPLEDTIYIPSWKTLAAVDAIQLKETRLADTCILVTYQATVASSHDINVKGLQDLLGALASVVSISRIEHHFVVPGHQFVNHYKVQQKFTGDELSLNCRGRKVGVRQYVVQLAPQRPRGGGSDWLESPRRVGGEARGTGAGRGEGMAEEGDGRRSLQPRSSQQ